MIKLKNFFRIALTVVSFTLLFGVLLVVPLHFAGWIVKAFPTLEYGEMSLSHLWNCISIALVVFGLINKDKIILWFKKIRFKRAGQPFQFDIGNGAVLMPVSIGIQNRWIFNWLEPKYVSLMYTERSRDVAVKLIQEYKSSGIHFFQNENDIINGEDMLEDAYDIQTCKKTAEKLLKEIIDVTDMPRSEIAADITAGTAVMTVGIFQAAEELNISTIYIKGRDKDNHLIADKRESGNPRYISERV